MPDNFAGFVDAFFASCASGWVWFWRVAVCGWVLRGRPFTLSPGFLPLGSRLVTFFAAHSVSVGAFHSVSVGRSERRRGNGIVDVATRFGCCCWLVLVPPRVLCAVCALGQVLAGCSVTGPGSLLSDAEKRKGGRRQQRRGGGVPPPPTRFVSRCHRFFFFFSSHARSVRRTYVHACVQHHHLCLFFSFLLCHEKEESVVAAMTAREGGKAGVVLWWPRCFFTYFAWQYRTYRFFRLVHLFCRRGGRQAGRHTLPSPFWGGVPIIFAAARDNFLQERMCTHRS